MGVGSSSEKQLLDQIFNLKFTSKQLARSANKCVKDEKSEKLKVRARAFPLRRGRGRARE